MDANYRCFEVLPLFYSDATDALERLAFYLETIEGFIHQEKSAEVADLKRRAEGFAVEHQGEFWAWHYPVHWDEIFASQLRSSFVVTLLSLVESNVGMVSEQTREIARVSIRPQDLRGGPIERGQKFLLSLAGFSRPVPKEWEMLLELRDVRNCIVHANSRMWDSTKQKRLRSLIGRRPGLQASQDVLNLGPEFPRYGLKVVREFITTLYSEAQDICRRHTQ